MYFSVLSLAKPMRESSNSGQGAKESCRRWDCSGINLSEWTPEGELSRKARGDGSRPLQRQTYDGMSMSASFLDEFGWQRRSFYHTLVPMQIGIRVFFYSQTALSEHTNKKERGNEK